jgi:hypothetical protein
MDIRYWYRQAGKKREVKERKRERHAHANHCQYATTGRKKEG